MSSATSNGTTTSSRLPARKTTTTTSNTTRGAASATAGKSAVKSTGSGTTPSSSSFKSKLPSSTSTTSSSSSKSQISTNKDGGIRKTTKTTKTTTTTTKTTTIQVLANTSSTDNDSFVVSTILPENEQQQQQSEIIVKSVEIPESYSISSESIDQQQHQEQQDVSETIEPITTTTTTTTTSQKTPNSTAKTTVTKQTTTKTTGIKKPISTTSKQPSPSSSKPTTTGTTKSTSGLKKPVSSTSATTTATAGSIKKPTTTTATTSSSASTSSISKPKSTTTSTTTTGSSSIPKKVTTTTAPTGSTTLSSIKKPVTVSTKATTTTTAAPATSTSKTTTTANGVKPTTSSGLKPKTTTTTTTTTTSAIKKPTTTSSKQPSTSTSSALKKPTSTTKSTTTTSPSTTSSIKKPVTTSTTTTKATATTTTAAIKKATNTTVKTTNGQTTKKPSTTTPSATPKAATSSSLATKSLTATSSKSTPSKSVVTNSNAPSVLGSMSSTQLLSNPKSSRPAGPSNRKKPTVNPVKNLAGKSSITSNSPSKSKSGGAANVTGFGLLASVDPSDVIEWKNKKLNKTDDKNKNRLIKFTGKKSIVGRLVELHFKSIRSNCCYILDTGLKIYEWRGSASNKIQHSMAMDLAGRIRNKERGGRPQSIIIEDTKKTNNSTFESEFWEAIGTANGSRPKDIPEETEDEQQKNRVKDILYCLTLNDSDNNNTKPSPQKNSKQQQQQQPVGILKGEVIKYAGKMLTKELLSSTNSYVVDCWSEVYLWVGKQTDAQVKKHSMAKAEELLASRKNRPSWVSIVRIIEDGETELFKEKFIDWSRSLPISMAPTPKGRVADVKKEEFKVESIKIDQPLPATFTAAIDDCRGTIQMWRVKDHSMEPLEQHLYGHFFTGESYVIVYRYMQKNRECFLTYFWQGKRSTINEKGESARLAVDMDDTLGSVTKKIRVVQNKEPIHFLNIFGGFIIVHNGVLDLDRVRNGVLSEKSVAMYQVRSCNHHNSTFNWRVIELDDVSSKYLNSNDWFIIKTSANRFYIWKGLNYRNNTTTTTTNDNRLELIINKLLPITKVTTTTTTTAIITNEEEEVEETEEKEEEESGVEIVLCNERQEPTVFWNDIGDVRTRFSDIVEHSPLMFQCSYSSGSFTVDRVFEFDQDDLDDEDVMIFDCHTAVYLWIGRRSTQDERKASMSAVLDYITKINTQQRLDLLRHKENEKEKIAVKEEEEEEEDGAEIVITTTTTTTTTTNNSNNSNVKSLEDYVFLIDSGYEPVEFTRYFHGSWDTRKKRGPPPLATIKVADYLKALNRTYTLEELQNNPPKALDSTKLETYLSDSDFENLFKMDKATFAQQKIWKQENLKKSFAIY
ncbi:hypothetical protein PPL_08041 [Heterostelium album PN500]|uniref:HP domain-containing protein n=1 Tax=Heterostelium pallidum (strain ATCC 26659 / Pp 5 / PN500) TaxID=670386 RepID=D3BHN6_HETP5|nr:hypothetical protein PPL_08041 [Heterostelium album PN500]EFA79213.1 hypothetical protein PPL_08041 [Heterostelium album PN500]|eukprot:XP_020431334.1 hypothetical protein PPL_08041 [Heterostelium album PN500]